MLSGLARPCLLLAVTVEGRVLLEDAGLKLP